MSLRQAICTSCPHLKCEKVCELAGKDLRTAADKRMWTVKCECPLGQAVLLITAYDGHQDVRNIGNLPCRSCWLQ